MLNIGNRLLYWIMIVSIVISMFRIHFQDLDRLQRKILKRILGWRRIAGEDWNDSMLRMNQRFSRAEQLYVCQRWPISFVRTQWKYVFNIIDVHPLRWIVSTSIQCTIRRRPYFLTECLVVHDYDGMIIKFENFVIKSWTPLNWYFDQNTEL